MVERVRNAIAISTQWTGVFSRIMQFPECRLHPPDDPTPVAAWREQLAGLLAAKQWSAAREVSRLAVEAHPSSPDLLVSAAMALMKLDRAAEAEQYVLKAAALLPASPVVWNNLGLALRNQNRVSEALGCFEKALRLRPDWERAHYDRAYSLLLTGDYDHGFEEYEHRWGANELVRPGENDPGMRRRLWRGEDPKGKRVLVYSEQGLGDTVQFGRYVALLQARGAEVVLEVQAALRQLMTGMRPECEIGNGEVASLAWDFHCPMMTLPLSFGTTLATIPPPAVFHVPEAIRCKWKDRITETDELTVGLVWAGNPENPMDDRRSTTLSALRPVLGTGVLGEGTRFFSFQVGERAAELQADPYRGLICDLSCELSEATDTAAALLRMDLVITVDTFVAHLAASLGVTVWLLLPFAPDWRWLLGRDDSPWYPSMRLFRPRAAGDWTGVAELVHAALHTFCLKRE